MTTVQDQLWAVRRVRSVLDRKVGEARALGHRGQDITAEVTALRRQVAVYERVAGLFNQIGEQRQADAQAKIEALVTLGLQTIFGEELSFRLVAREARSSATVDFVVRTTLPDGVVLDTPVMDSRGGGLAATVGFLVRLVVLLLSAERQETVLFLDETFSMVSSEYLGRLSELLRDLVNQTGVQILMVTHQDALAENADRVYHFQLGKNGTTEVQSQ